LGEEDLFAKSVLKILRQKLDWRKIFIASNKSWIDEK